MDHHVKPGDMMFFPAQVFHSIKVLTERIKLLVIYSPPYGEDPAKVIRTAGFALKRWEGNTVRTQVGIIGAGPAGLFLAHLLHRAGISSVIIEARSREDVEGTVRAGVLEHWVVELMKQMGLGARMMREGHFHDGITLQWNRERFHLDIEGLTGGKRVVVYPQHEVLKDLIAGRLDDGGSIIFGVGGTAIHGIETDTPSITFRHDKDGAAETIHCDFVIGADGFHGPGRQAIPSASRTEYERSIRSAGWVS